MKQRVSTWFKRIGLSLLAAVLLLTGFVHVYIRHFISAMPGESYTETTTATNATTAATAARMRAHVDMLANHIGGRSIYNMGGLKKAENYIAGEFRKLGLEPEYQTYKIEPDLVNEVVRRLGPSFALPEYGDDQPVKEVANLWVEFKGSTFPEQLLVVGAHYDTVGFDCPGANDNGTGIAGLFEVARHLLKTPPRSTVLLAAFTCEEYPVGDINKMGSAVFVEDHLLAQGRQAVGMISFDTIGSFSNEKGSQEYPFPFSLYYPDTANFIGFVGDATSRGFIRKVVGGFRKTATVPSQGVAAPSGLVPDVLRSDHEYFIKHGIPGLMVTDTGNFRYAHYHHDTDTPDKVSFTKAARILEGICPVIQEFE